MSASPPLRNPDSSSGVPAPGFRREDRIAAVTLTFTACTFFMIQYDRMRPAGPALAEWVRLKLAGTLSEGDQYRIAIPYLAHSLQLHTRLKLTQSVPLIEFIFYTLALTSLYALLRTSPRMQQADRMQRLVLLGFFLTAVQFPTLWVFPWDRVETLPVTFYLATTVLLIVRRSRIPFPVVCLLVAVLSLGQSFARSDAPIVLGFATVVAAAISLPFPRSRSSIAVLGVLCGSVGVGTQLFLRHLIPNVNPAQTQNTLQLFRNLDLFHPPLHIPFFLTAMIPFFFSLALLRRNWPGLDSSDKLVLLICLIYLPIYIALGIIVEVRIYVPYLFLASPTIAKLWTSYLFGGGQTADAAV